MHYIPGVRWPLPLPLSFSLTSILYAGVRPRGEISVLTERARRLLEQVGRILRALMFLITESVWKVSDIKKGAKGRAQSEKELLAQ